MTKPIDFDQDFANAITGFQEFKIGESVVTHINMGSNTLSIDGDIRKVLSDIFPCTLPKPVPFTKIEPEKLYLTGTINPDMNIRMHRDVTGW